MKLIAGNRAGAKHGTGELFTTPLDGVESMGQSDSHSRMSDGYAANTEDVRTACIENCTGMS